MCEFRATSCKIRKILIHSDAQESSDEEESESEDESPKKKSKKEESEEEEEEEEEEEMKVHKKVAPKGMEDETLECRDCSAEFVFTVGEQEFFKEKGARSYPYNTTLR